MFVYRGILILYIKMANKIFYEMCHLFLISTLSLTHLFLSELCQNRKFLSKEINEVGGSSSIPLNHTTLHNVVAWRTIFFFRLLRDILKVRIKLDSAICYQILNHQQPQPTITIVYSSLSSLALNSMMHFKMCNVWSVDVTGIKQKINYVMVSVDNFYWVVRFSEALKIPRSS